MTATCPLNASPCRPSGQRLRLHACVAIIGAAFTCLVNTPLAFAQGIGFAGDDPLKYGALYRTFEREHGALVQNFDAELRTLRANGATPGEIQVATERFMTASRRIDAQFKQPVIEKMIDVANQRVSEVVDTSYTPPRKPADPTLPPEKPSAVPGREDPSKLIKPSAGTRPGQPGHRGGLGDTDAAGGTRAVDHLERIAAEMGLTRNDSDTLFERKPGYSATTDPSELNLAAHKSGRLDRVGSNAWQTQIEADALQPETYLSVDMGKDQAGRDYVAVRDHQSKAQKGLKAAPADLLPAAGQGVNLKGAAELQGMSKGTLKALDTANLSDEALTALIRKNGIGESPAKVRNVLNVLKGGAAIAPDGVGLHAENMGQFQNLCRDILDESATVTKAQADERITTLTDERDRLELSRNAEDRKRAQKIREELVDSRKRMQESERAGLREDVDKLTQQRERIATDKTTPDAERQKRMQQIDAEIEQRRNRQAVRDLDADVNRRRVVDGESVIRDLERPRRPVDDERARRTIIADDRPEMPPTKRQGILTHPVVSRGMVLGGQLLAVHGGLSVEYAEAEKRLKARQKQQDPNATGEPGLLDVLSEVSYTRVGLRTIAGLTGIEGAVVAGQQAKYEWVTGTNNYIESQIDRYRRAGYDELPTGIAMTIAIKATARQVTLSTYQGAKGVPLIGDLVAFPENLFVVTESTVGVLYDKMKTSQTIAQNTIDQLEQERHAAGLAQRLIKDMETLVSDAGRELAALDELWRLVPRAEAQDETLRDQFRTDSQALETSVAQLPVTPEAALQWPDETQVGEIESDITALTRECSGLSLRCDLLERDLNGGRIECATIREWARPMHGELAGFVLRHDLLVEAIGRWEDQLQATVPLTEALQRRMRLQETMDWSARAAASLRDTVQTAASIAQNLRTQQARLEFIRQQVLQLHARFSDRAKVGADFQEWEDIRIRVGQLKIEAERPAQDVAAAQQRLGRVAGYLDLLARSELPELPISEQPRRIGGQLSGDLTRLQQPQAELTHALDLARNKLDGLQQLCPEPKPAIRLVARAVDAATFDFDVLLTNVDEQAKHMYVWDFGDSSQDAARVATQRHKYARPGTYRVSVRVFEERPDFSSELGEALASVVAEAMPLPETPTPDAIMGNVVVLLQAGWKLDLEPPDPPPPPPGKSLDEIMEDFGKNMKLPKAGDVFVQLNNLTFRHVPGTNEVEYEFHAETFVTLVDGFAPGYPKHKLEVTGTGRGPINPQTGAFQLRVDQVTWSEDLPNQFPRQVGYRRDEVTGFTVPYSELVPMTAEQRAEGLAVAYRALGGPPSAMSWTGQISGQLDWNNYSKGSGRLELNQVFRGTWKTYSNQPYRIEWPSQIAPPNGSLPILLVHPNETAAQSRYRTLTQFGRIWGYQAGPLEGVGDESRASPHGAAIIRSGRWTFDFSRGELQRTSPQAFAQAVQQVRQYIATNRLEEMFPEQPGQE